MIDGPTMTVFIDGKEARRRIVEFETDMPFRDAVPVLTRPVPYTFHGERSAWLVNGECHILKTYL